MSKYFGETGLKVDDKICTFSALGETTAFTVEVCCKVLDQGVDKFTFKVSGWQIHILGTREKSGMLANTSLSYIRGCKFESNVK